MQGRLITYTVLLILIAMVIFLTAHRLVNVLHGGMASLTVDTPTITLLSMTRVLRDPEILAYGYIPASCVRRILIY